MTKPAAGPAARPSAGSSSKKSGGEERRLPAASEILASWSVKNISVQPFGPGWWSFNPSVHHDPVDRVWRCVFRCANYSLPGGVPRLSSDARAGRAATRNAIAILAPSTLEVIRLREMRELDDRPRVAACSSLGYEDMRLFRTQRDGMCGIATALQLNEAHPGRPEMVLCRLDQAGDVVETTPIRGTWSQRPQKNWSPFDGTQEPRFLYSIERGVIMSDAEAVIGSPMSPNVRVPPRVANNIGRCGAEVKVMGAAPSAYHPPMPATPVPGSTDLRGGSQLLEIEPGRWLGIAHEMRLKPPNRTKLYWHTLYTCDGWGRLLQRSPPFKLSTAHGIEFAAGLAVDRRGGVAISFGTDDHDSWIAVTDLDSIERVLRPVDRTIAGATGAVDDKASADPADVSLEI